MTKKELLTAMQQRARELGSLADWYRSYQESEMSTVFHIKQKANHKVQDIIRENDINAIQAKVCDLRYDCLNNIHYYRNLGLSRFMEYHAIVMSEVGKYCGMIEQLE